MKTTVRIIAVCCLLVCASPGSAQTRQLTGTWGGRSAVLDLDAARGQLTVRCGGEGEVDGPVVPDEFGAFRVTGTFRPYVLGGGLGPPVGVVYFGEVRGKTMALTVQVVEAGEVVRTVVLRQGKRQDLAPCPT